MIYHFEKLGIWTLSMDLAMEIYDVTESFPSKEKYGVTNQLRRAITSVSANIAEGSTRISMKDKGHFLQFAFGSLIEVLNFLIFSERRKYLSKDEYLRLRLLIEELSNKVNAYNKKLPITQVK